MKKSKSNHLSLEKLQVAKLNNPDAIRGGESNTVKESLLSRLRLCALQ